MSYLKILIISIFYLFSLQARCESPGNYPGFGIVYLDKFAQLPWCSSANLGSAFYIEENGMETIYFCDANLKWNIFDSKLPRPFERLTIACNGSFEIGEGRLVYLELMRTLTRDDNFYDHCLLTENETERGGAYYTTKAEAARILERRFGCRFGQDYYTYLTPDELSSGQYISQNQISGRVHFIPVKLCDYSRGAKKSPLMLIAVPPAPVTMH